ncbi:BAG family molecular chaperone regulator 2-like [Littorina saxatilis]|uniref:Uncharacterized protein n=1 Tax=Littorina saxatilis TaxID=31220 RepID=A0AAN9B6N0_9CAEN
MAAAASSSDDEMNKNPIAADSYTLCSFVDEVESRVDMFRKQAMAMVGEQASLLLIIDQLKNDCCKSDLSPEDYQELVTNMERLKARIEAVQIHVHTVRDDGQVEALDKVNNALQELHSRLYSEEHARSTAVKQAHTYLNACLPEAVGSVDLSFQSMVIGCALDDQKDVRRRLETLLRDCSRQTRPGSTHSSVKKTDPASSERSNNATASLESTNTGEASVKNKPTSNKEKDANSRDSIQNHLREEWFSAPNSNSKDDDLSVTQQQGESIEQLHAKTDNTKHNHSNHPA